MATLQSLEKKMDTMFEKLSSQIEHLAIMMKEGFDHLTGRVDGIDKRLDGIDYRLDRIENISVGGHERRIEHLEDNVRVINTKLKLN